MNEKIISVDNENNDFINLCIELDNIHNDVVAEQRRKGANCVRNLDTFSQVFVAYIDDNPAGCIAIKEPVNGVIEIGRVCVYKQYRNKGIASKLLQRVEEEAKSQRAKALILDTYERLDSAVKLYKKMGFKVIPQSEDFGDSPYSLCMLKELM